MQIVIDIPEETYEYWKEHSYEYVFAQAIKDSIILPKGHGRLIDADALIESLDSSDRDIYCKGVIEEDASTIIEADKGERSGEEEYGSK